MPDANPEPAPLVVATGNPGKAAEIRELLADAPVRVAAASERGGMPSVEESGATFEANARLKARALRARCAPGDWTLADDSGLETDALGGAPGVRSARYAGEGASDAANVDALLAALAGTRDPAARAARFRCVLVLLAPDGEAFCFSGACEGRIAEAPSGEAGFGYDPVFIPEGHDRTFAELGEGAKARLSHRAEAVRRLRAFFVERGA